jgi:hypothetical protein
MRIQIRKSMIPVVEAPSAYVSRPENINALARKHRRFRPKLTENGRHSDVVGTLQKRGHAALVRSYCSFPPYPYISGGTG